MKEFSFKKTYIPTFLTAGFFLSFYFSCANDALEVKGAYPFKAGYYDSYDEVLQAEGAPSEQTETTLSYRRRWAGLDGTVRYFFDVNNYLSYGNTVFYQTFQTEGDYHDFITHILDTYFMRLNSKEEFRNFVRTKNLSSPEEQQSFLDNFIFIPSASTTFYASDIGIISVSAIKHRGVTVIDYRNIETLKQSAFLKAWYRANASVNLYPFRAESGSSLKNVIHNEGTPVLQTETALSYYKSWLGLEGVLYYGFDAHNYLGKGSDTVFYQSFQVAGNHLSEIRNYAENHFVSIASADDFISYIKLQPKYAEISQQPETYDFTSENQYYYTSGEYLISLEFNQNHTIIDFVTFDNFFLEKAFSQAYRELYK
jgi:hypothetical protein